MVSPWVTLGLLFGFAAIWAWLARNLTPTRLMNLQARGVSAMSSAKYDDARAIFVDLLTEARHHKRGWDLKIAALTFLAAIHELKDEPAEAVEAWDLAAAERNKSATRFDALIAIELAKLARRVAALGKCQRAESLAGRALELAEQSPDIGEGAVVPCLQARSDVFLRQRKPEQAIPLLEKAWSIASAFGPDDPRPLRVQTDLAIALWRMKRFDAAGKLFDSAIEDLEHVVASEGFVPDALVALLHSRGHLAADLGQHEKAHQDYDRAVRLCEMTGREDKWMGTSLTFRGNALTRLGRHDEAEADLKRAIGLFRKETFPDSPAYLFAQVTYASLQSRMGRHDKAIRLASHVLAVSDAPRASEPGATPEDEARSETPPDDEQDEVVPTPALADVADTPFNVLSVLTVLARAHFDLGHFDSSEQFAQRAVATAERHLPEVNLSLGRNLHRLALIQAHRGALDASRVLFERAIATYEALEDRSELADVKKDRDGAGTELFRFAPNPT